LTTLFITQKWLTYFRVRHNVYANSKRENLSNKGMQDEITKHTKKIYDTAKNKKYTFGKKVKEILIEIFIIVFAVTLSIWFHSWSDHRHEQEEVSEFLRGLKDDLTEDIHMLETNKNVITRLDSNFHFLLSLHNTDKAISDSLISLDFDLRVTRPNIGRYEGFKSSGKIGTIENDSLKEKILVFYEQAIPDLVYGENFVNDLQSKILNLEIDDYSEISIRDFVTSEKMKILLHVATQNFETNIRGYNNVIKKAKTIITRIDKETK
jgi:hypothetical protein